MTYWVFDSWTLGKAIIHRAGCSFCLDGNHRQGTMESNNGTWRGPMTREAAFTLAHGLTRKVTRGCNSCAP